MEIVLVSPKQGVLSSPPTITGVEGVAGSAVEIVTGRLDVVLVPQEFVAATVIVPLLADPFVDTVMDAVPVPDVIVHPGGSVQL